MVNKAPKQCTSLFKVIMTEEGGCFKAAPSLQTHRGAFAQPKAWLLCISHQRHQTWQARPFSCYQLHYWTQGPWLRITVYETHSTNSHDYFRKWTTGVWARVQNISNTIVIQCPTQRWKRNTVFFPLITDRKKITNFNGITTLTLGWDILVDITHAQPLQTYKESIHQLVANYFDNQLTGSSISFQAKSSNICWFQFPKCQGLLLFFVIYENKWRVFGF